MYPVIPIARPMIGEREKEAVLQVLDSGVIAHGPAVQEFEKAFARMVGVREAVAVSSGTAALMVALVANGIGKGDEVITTPFSFIASSNSILFAGARPRFVDVCEDDFNINPSLIEEAVTSRTKGRPYSSSLRSSLPHERDMCCCQRSWTTGC